MSAPTSLTERQKLQALADRYYGRTDNPWQPKKGDYYTSSRADLELYRIVDENETRLFTAYCDTSRGSAISEWPKSEFLSGFGISRLEVKPYIFDL